MKKLVGFLGATIGGYAGWWLGALAGTMTAFMLSIVGTGIGMYAAYRASQEYLP